MIFTSIENKDRIEIVKNNDITEGANTDKLFLKPYLIIRISRNIE